MNIALINSARTWGGTEKWTLMAADALQKRHTVRLIYRRDIVGSRFSIPTHQLPLTSHIDPYSLARLVALIKKEKIEILIPTKRKDYVLAGIASKLTGIPVILRLGADRQLRWPWQRFMYHTLTNGVIVNAEKIKRTLLSTGWFPEEKIRVIYNGIDTAQIDRKKTEPYQKPFPVTVSALGRVTKNKGFDFLIRAFARFQENTQAKGIGIVIIGDGEDMQEFRNLAASLGISDKVIFTGFLQNPYPILRESDIFAMTSKNEGLPNALLEAMYLHNTPICTPAGGTEEALENEKEGIMIPYNDEQALARAITELYLNPERRKNIAELAHQRALRQFSIERMGKELGKFCSEIIG
ncbi:MAG: glycosyltransferase [Prosthecochloris sp.]|nr:glycosyltransferase [Prosthecochloris sp.]